MNLLMQHFQGYEHHFSGWGWLCMIFFLFILFCFASCILMWFFRGRNKDRNHWFAHRGWHCSKPGYYDREESEHAEEILRKRFANGEISSEEYQKMLEVLRGKNK